MKVRSASNSSHLKIWQKCPAHCHAHWTGGWKSPMASLDILTNSKILVPARTWNQVVHPTKLITIYLAHLLSQSVLLPIKCQTVNIPTVSEHMVHLNCNVKFLYRDNNRDTASSVVWEVFQHNILIHIPWKMFYSSGKNFTAKLHNSNILLKKLNLQLFLTLKYSWKRKPPSCYREHHTICAGNSCWFVNLLINFRTILEQQEVLENKYLE